MCSVCVGGDTLATACVWRSVELVLSFHLHMGLRGQTQVFGLASSVVRYQVFSVEGRAKLRPPVYLHKLMTSVNCQVSIMPAHPGLNSLSSPCAWLLEGYPQNSLVR